MKTRTERLFFYCEPELKRAIENAAYADERSVSDWLRLTIRRVANNAPNVTSSDARIRGIADATRRIAKDYT